MPNILAHIALFGWPVVVYVLFRKLPQVQALGWSIFAGYLLLPTQVGLDLPGLPMLDKDRVPVLSAWLMLLLGVGASVPARKAVGAKAQNGPTKGASATSGPLIVSVMLALYFLSPLLTSLANSDPVPAGPLVLPGLGPKDAFLLFLEAGTVVLPFLLARHYFASPESHVTLLKVLALGMIAYSLPILLEVRMSPQLNTMFYGFFPHDFLQHMREGGFRPVVFLHHGLWLAILVAMSVLSAAALWRCRLSGGQRAGQWFYITLYLLVILFLCRSLGALAIGLLLLPVVLLFGVRIQLLAASLVAAMVLLYPMLRAADLVPVDRVLELAQSSDAERAESLEFRLVNEAELLDRAALRPLLGWGSWGRPMIYDPETGRSTSIADGSWIILFGIYGWLGYIATFGLLTLPIIVLAVRRRVLALDPATAGLALVLAANLIDMLLNATLTPVTWMIGGALVGRCSYRATASDAGTTGVGGAAQLSSRRAWGLVTDKQATVGQAGPDLGVSSPPKARRIPREA